MLKRRVNHILAGFRRKKAIMIDHMRERRIVTDMEADMMTGSMIMFNENTVHQNIMKTLVTKRGTKSLLPSLSPHNPQVHDQKEAAAGTQRGITRTKEGSISRENREKREIYLRIVNRVDTMMTTRIDLSSDHME